MDLSRRKYKLKEIRQPMKTKELHDPGKAVQALPLFKERDITVISLQLLKGSKLDKHISPISAVITCTGGSGELHYEDGEVHPMDCGSYVKIEPGRAHWVTAEEDSYFLLIR